MSLKVDLGDGEHPADPGHGGGGPRQTAKGRSTAAVRPRRLIADRHGSVDGFHLVPLEPRRDLEPLVNGTVALQGSVMTVRPSGRLTSGHPRPLVAPR
ncbi:hypothetical protein ABZ864_27475 [Streptomyces sp. NPDC047082]|uniref:hypothetical protein n=1 Tax=Streptomyces sp. NPDC047082 TaxID=3155259 RepID=UPI0033F978A5